MKAKVIKTGEIVEVYHEPQHGQVSNVYKESVLINGRIWMENELDFCLKTNESPKKIYISTSNIGDNHYSISKTANSADKKYEVEYIRIDSFIEKAVEFFEENIEEENCKIGSSEWIELRAEYKSLDSFIRAFVEYMKGE